MVKDEKDTVAILSHQHDEVKLSSIKNIILDALFSSSNRSLNETDLDQFIESSFGVLIQSKQLKGAIAELNADGSVSCNSGVLSLNDAVFLDMTEKRANDTKIKEKALSEWAQKSNISLGDENSSKILDCIDTFVNLVFIKHGVISYSLIAEAKAVDQFEIETIAETVLKSTDPQISKLIGDKLRLILSTPFSDETLKYLKNSAKKAVYYLSSIVPENTIQSLEERLKDLTIYLDTNVVYRLLGLQGERRYQDVHDVISFCQDRKVTVKISARTYDELVATLRRDGNRILQWRTDPQLAKAGFELRNDDNYLSTFWAATSKTGISARDFNEKYKHPNILLASFNIEIESNTVKNDNISAMASDFASKIAQDDTDKTMEPIYHDAYNLAYVKAQQKSTASTAIESGCLFMTSDQSLLHFQVNDAELKKSLPICILPSQLLQIFSFNQSKDEYYETYIRLFASAANIYHTTGHDNKHIQEIMGRLSQYKTLDKGIAIRILETELLNANYLNATNEEREDIIYNEITHSLEGALDSITKEAEELLAKNQILYEERQTFNMQADASIRTISELKNSCQKLEESNHGLKEKIVASKMRNYIIIRALSLFFGLLLFGLATYCFFVDNPSNIHEYITYVAGIFMILFFIYGYPILSSKKRKAAHQKYYEEENQ